MILDLAQSAAVSVPAAGIGLTLTAGLLRIDERRQEPPGRHRNPAGTRARWRDRPTAGRVTGSIGGILPAVRQQRQEAAWRTYAYNLWAASPAGRKALALRAFARLGRALSTKDGAP